VVELGGPTMFAQIVDRRHARSEPRSRPRVQPVTQGASLGVEKAQEGPMTGSRINPLRLYQV
jgi:hypothetical protein